MTEGLLQIDMILSAFEYDIENFIMLVAGN